MTTHCSVYTQTLPNNQFSASWKTITRVVSLWHERARQRRHLARLDDRALRDIGVDRASAHFEASKPFWRG
jgi:uncharacterized protein YjiS (DUF1127 family)